MKYQVRPGKSISCDINLAFSARSDPVRTDFDWGSSIRFDSLGGLCVELSLRDPLKLCMASVGGDDVEV